MGRLLAICGWLAWQVRRPLRQLGTALPIAVAVLLVIVAALPIVIPQLDPQPQDATVQEVVDGAVTEPAGWIRLQAHVIVPLSEAPTDERGRYGLLVDETDELRAIVLRSEQPITADESTAITGHLAEATVVVEEDLPIEATVAGTPPTVVPDRLLELDPTPKPVRVVLWPLSIPPLLLAAMLVVGSRVGYPVFRPTSEIDVLTGPLGPGERLPAAYGGRIGPNVRALADPGGALLLVRRGPKGNLLTAQPLADDGGVAPAPVTIGGSWTSGRIGYVYTLSETVAALLIRSELVDATFLFARRAERDRVAALITVER
ncbi:MAG TPA: hypothetical protein VFH79_07855 [Candidatus Limnocylindria bacterium]|nr:hypothetical protein [Candidatus Limnocylindria bacterium]